MKQTLVKGQIMSMEFSFCQKCSNVVGDKLHGHKKDCPEFAPTYLTEEVQEANDKVFPEYKDFEIVSLTEA